MDALQAITEHELVEQLSAIGVTPGSALVVHASFRSVGPVEDGPRGFIEALLTVLGPEGTLVMPTMTGSRRPEPYDPRSTPTRNMGIVAETFWRLPGVLRSDHPTSSFASFGPRAAEITTPQPLEPVTGLDSPIGRVFQLGGDVLLLGVGHDVNTTIHLAETLCNVPYRVEKWATIPKDGQPFRVDFREIVHCCKKFALVDGWLREGRLQREGIVGRARARLARSRDIVEVASEHLSVNLTIFLHPRGSGCAECEAAWTSIPEGYSPASAQGKKSGR